MQLTRRTRRHIGLSFRYVALFLLLLFVLSPAVWLFSIAFKSQPEILSGVPSVIPQEPTFDNFIAAFRQSFVQQGIA